MDWSTRLDVDNAYLEQCAMLIDLPGDGIIIHYKLHDDDSHYWHGKYVGSYLFV